MSNKLLKKRYNGHFLYRVIPDPLYLTLLTNGYGSLIADAMSGYSGNVVHLTATPDAGYAFSNYECTGATIVGNDLTFGREDCTAKANFDLDTYTLTLQTDGHGTLTANKITGHVGDTVTLTPTYNTYYRFNNYQNTGGSISNNIFTFGAENATAKANFMNGLTSLIAGLTNDYITNPKDEKDDKAILYIDDINFIVDSYINSVNASKIFKNLEKSYVIPSDAFKNIYHKLLVGYLQMYVSIASQNGLIVDNNSKALYSRKSISL